MDVHDKKTRSYNMSKIRSKDTRIELIVRQFLFKNGFRYRLHYNKLPGKPDIVFPKNKIAIFVHGCYFHKHAGCKLAATSKTRTEFWKNKIEDNVLRDKRNENKLREMRWNVIRLWECEIEPRKKNSQIREETLTKLKNNILKIKINNDSSN